MKLGFYLLCVLCLSGCVSVRFSNIQHGMTYQNVIEELGLEDTIYRNPSNNHFFIVYKERRMEPFSADTADYIVEFDEDGMAYSKTYQVNKEQNTERQRQSTRAVGLMLQGIGQSLQQPVQNSNYINSQPQPYQNTNCTSQIIGNTVYTNCH